MTLRMPNEDLSVMNVVTGKVAGGLHIIYEDKLKDADSGGPAQ